MQMNALRQAVALRRKLLNSFGFICGHAMPQRTLSPVAMPITGRLCAGEPAAMGLPGRSFCAFYQVLMSWPAGLKKRMPPGRGASLLRRRRT
jgi:hypothetical protein